MCWRMTSTTLPTRTNTLVGAAPLNPLVDDAARGTRARSPDAWSLPSRARRASRTAGLLGRAQGFADPVQFFCSADTGREPAWLARSAELCAQSLAPFSTRSSSTISVSV